MRWICRGNIGATAILWGSFRPASVISFAFPPMRTKRSLSTQPLFISKLTSSSSIDTNNTEEESRGMEISSLKVLALHGSGGTAEEFPKRLDSLNKALLFHSKEGDKVKLEITAVQGPFDKNEGFCWWTMPHGVRSFNAKEYTGFEESASRVLDVWETGDFDIVLGHSQGAILVGALLALERMPYHPRLGYIMNGVSFPNPYASELESLYTEEPPSILFLLGKRDKIAPNATGEKLRGLLHKGGYITESCYHDGGHGFPERDTDDDTMKTIANWILHRRHEL